MKKIVVMSDNHGHDIDIMTVQEENKDADLFIHCGDSEGYLELLENFIAVKGNNDWNFPLERVIVFEFDGMKMAVIHGDQFGYFSRESRMIEFSEEYGVQIIFTGHTHMPQNEVLENGVRVINPGSTYLPRGGTPRSYAVVYKEGNNIDVEFRGID